ncbi:MAG: hypothetical protein A2Y15_08895 [Clostridiales bacterium GWF2_36_10]|nr:MAG: hypothetical protein A2Y15_08895 [Clostridiales bacterium GWF2_36_10]HAN20590.1 hypothetical protein [Clostridiales bacterium]
MYSFRVCPQCGKMSFPLDVSPGCACPFCGHEIIKVKYSGQYQDGYDYAVQDDYAKQQKEIIETVVKPHPEFNKNLYEKRLADEYNTLQRTILFTLNCSVCGSSNIQYTRKKRTLVKGYNIEKYCASCGKKIK